MRRDFRAKSRLHAECSRRKINRHLVNIRKTAHFACLTVMQKECVLRDTPASLSAMAQGVGYTAAALGPLAFGLLHDASHDWNSATVLFMVIGTAALIAGVAAGRDRHVEAIVTRM